MSSLFEKYKITDKVVVITGGAGLIGRRHCEAVLEGGGIPVLVDIFQDSLKKVKNDFLEKYNNARIEIYKADITKIDELKKIKDELLSKYGHIDGLINNAANNPKVEGGGKKIWEQYSSTTFRSMFGTKTWQLGLQARFYARKFLALLWKNRIRA